MKHVFIVNPAAGKENSRQRIQQLLTDHDFDYQIYETKGAKDATDYIITTCNAHPEEQYCFYACGGDGTINEVVNGVMRVNNACMSTIPVGSGNDYVKYFGGADRFMNIDDLINGEEMQVDVMKINGEMYSVNVVNFGLDSKVAKVQQAVKRKPIIGGNNSYYTGIIAALFTAVRNKADIYVDGEKVNDGTYLMCTLANGSFVGGSFNCAPRSVVDDGLMEFCMFECIPYHKMPPLLSKYTKGEHLNELDKYPFIHYKQARTVEIRSEKPMDLCVDGELITGTYFKIENLEKAMRFVAPSQK